MLVFVLFTFNGELAPIAVNGMEGGAADFVLPSVGDTVHHRDSAGTPFQGQVTDRIFHYDVKQGSAVQGAVSVTLCLDRKRVA